MGTKTRGTMFLTLLLALFATAAQARHAVSLDASLEATNGIGVKVLGTTLSTVGLVLSSVFIGFILIEFVLLSTIVYADYRSHAYTHLALGLLFNGGFLIFFWVSYYGGAVWLAPVVEDEFWFWVALTVGWTAWTVSWSLRVGPDFGRRPETAIDVSNPEQLVRSDSGMGRSWMWGFITAVMALCVTFALFDIVNLQLPLGISAIVLAVFWLIAWYFSFDNASRRARYFAKASPVKASKRSIYSWLRWNHIFVLLMFIFYALLYILGPGLAAVGDYQGIMIGYVIAYGLQGLAPHVYFFVFDYNKGKRLDKGFTSERMVETAAYPHSAAGSSLFNNNGGFTPKQHSY